MKSFSNEALSNIIILHMFNFRTGINELRNLQYLPRLSEAREYMFEDRTKAHADHVGHGLDRMTTAAVGQYETFMDPTYSRRHTFVTVVCL
jgi:hypothetical protein